MKKYDFRKYKLIFSLFAIAAASFGIVSCEKAPKGQNVTTTNIPMTQLEVASRRIWIYLPPGYENGDKYYPVLYMHDGQNLFDEKTSFAGQWEVGLSLDRLVREGKTEGAIVVGIDNGGDQRESEYAPWAGCSTKTPKGGSYTDFIVHSLKPFIDYNYRTLPDRANTGIAGSSSGGNISFYALMRYPETFGKAMLFSPALWCQQEENRNFLKTADLKRGVRVYMDVGTNEGEGNEPEDYVRETKHIYSELQKMDGVAVKLVVDEGGQHNEKYWAKRFPEAFLWTF